MTTIATIRKQNTVERGLSRLNKFHKEGRLIRYSYEYPPVYKKEGKQFATILAAFSYKFAKNKDPLTVLTMPRWLACVTPMLDELPEKEWAVNKDRYVAVLPRLLKLTPERLARVEAQSMAIALRENRQQFLPATIMNPLYDVLSVLDRMGKGDVVSPEEMYLSRKAMIQGSRKESIPWRAATAATAALAQINGIGLSVYYASHGVVSPWDKWHMYETWLTCWEEACDA